jgi:hypothetical protein
MRSAPMKNNDDIPTTDKTGIKRVLAETEILLANSFWTANQYRER